MSWIDRRTLVIPGSAGNAAGSFHPRRHLLPSFFHVLIHGRCQNSAPDRRMWSSQDLLAALVAVYPADGDAAVRAGSLPGEPAPEPSTPTSRKAVMIQEKKLFQLT